MHNLSFTIQSGRILDRSLCSRTMALANKTRTGEVSNRVWMWTGTNRVRGQLLTTLAGLQVHHLAPDLCLALLASTLPNLHRWSSSLLLKHCKSKLAGCAPLFHLHHPTVSVDSTLPSKRRRSRQWQTAPLSSTGGNSPHNFVIGSPILSPQAGATVSYTERDGRVGADGQVIKKRRKAMIQYFSSGMASPLLSTWGRIQPWSSLQPLDARVLV